MKIESIFGPWPEKTPLNARVTGVVERDTYKIENVIFESRPGFPVTALLYLPLTPPPYPGILLPCGHLLIAKEKKPAAFIEFGPPHSRSEGLGRGGALADGKPWPIKRGHHRFVALAIWHPDRTLAKTCADFSDLEIGPDGCVYLLSDKSSTIARLDDLRAGGGTAALLDAWQLGELDGKPEGLAFTMEGRALVGLDTRKPRRNLVLLEPAIAVAPP